MKKIGARADAKHQINFPRPYPFVLQTQHKKQKDNSSGAHRGECNCVFFHITVDVRHIECRLFRTLLNPNKFLSL